MINTTAGALTSVNDEANSHVSAFDLAFPGSQPVGSI